MAKAPPKKSKGSPKSRARPPARPKAKAKAPAKAARPAPKKATRSPSHASRPKATAKPAVQAPSAKPAPKTPLASEAPSAPVVRVGDGRRHLLSLSFLRDGDEFFARIESNAGQITEFKNRALDQLLTLVANELEDLLE